MAGKLKFHALRALAQKTMKFKQTAEIGKVLALDDFLLTLHAMFGPLIPQPPKSAVGPSRIMDHKGARIPSPSDAYARTYEYFANTGACSVFCANWLADQLNLTPNNMRLAAADRKEMTQQSMQYNAMLKLKCQGDLIGMLFGIKGMKIAEQPEVLHSISGLTNLAPGNYFVACDGVGAGNIAHAVAYRRRATPPYPYRRMDHKGARTVASPGQSYEPHGWEGWFFDPNAGEYHMYINSLAVHKEFLDLWHETYLKNGEMFESFSCYRVVFPA
jgi:hypothetical protein